jgi:hypothetical protein
MKRVKLCGLFDRMGPERMFFNAREVIRHYQEKYPDAAAPVSRPVA